MSSRGGYFVALAVILVLLSIVGGIIITAKPPPSVTIELWHPELVFWQDEASGLCFAREKRRTSAAHSLAQVPCKEAGL